MKHLTTGGTQVFLQCTSSNSQATVHPVRKNITIFRNFVLIHFYMTQVNSLVIIYTIAVINRPHHSTIYVAAADCYRRSSLVSASVALSVTIVSPAITAEQIHMLFGKWTQVGPRNHALIRQASRSPNAKG